MSNLLKTPQEYITEYAQKLRNDLNMYDLDVNYFGFVGFILNALGWGRFDSSQYYDFLFKEAFISTSDKDENLTLHGSIHNYNPTPGIPSQAIGNIHFDFDALPRFNSSIMNSREVHFGGNDIYFDIDQFRFYVQSKYIFYQDANQIKTIIIDPDGKIEHIPSASRQITVPLRNTKQYDIENINIKLPHYPFGSYYSYSIDLSKSFLYDIDIEVKESDSSEFNKYEYSFIKFLQDGNSKTVFLKNLSPMSFVIEFGSGIHGNWTPNSTVNIKIYSTHGSKGNLSHKNEYAVKIKSPIYMTTHYHNSDAQISNISPKLFNIEFEYSEGGKDMASGPQLRDNIITYIQSRDNLINDIDFKNIYEKYHTKNDFKFLLRKIGPIDNTFYLYNVFRNKYMNIIPTTNKFIEVLKYNDSSLIFSNINIETFHDDNGTLKYGEEYVYLLSMADSFGRTRTTTVGCEIENENHNAIRITWDDLEFINKYITYGRKSEFYVHKWELDSNEFIDYGNVPNPISNINLSFDYNENSILSNDEYTYRIQSILNDGSYSEIIDINTVIVDENNNNIHISWDGDLSVSYYRIFRESSNDTVFWKLHTTYFVDDGKNTTFNTINTDGHNVLVSTQSKFNNIIYKPVINNMISPFIYKYNSFFNRYDGYFEYYNHIENFREFNLINSDYIPPNIHLLLQYDPESDNTLIYVKSHQDISQYNLTITVEKYSINNTNMDNLDENTKIFRIHGMLTDSIQIIIGDIDNNFQAITNNFVHILDISDILSLFIFPIENSNYICTIPCIDNEYYLENPNNYLSKLYNMLISENISGNRMLTDSIQFRFLETKKIDSYYSERILRQRYYHDIILPLYLDIKIRADIDLLKHKNINVTSEKNRILMSVSAFLQEKATGTNISFYKSQIIDLIHDSMDYIKSVTVDIFDQDNHNLNNGIDTLDDNNIYKNILETSDYDGKIKLLQYTPVYWYWNYDLINIQIIY
ncbi:MAG: hypothetical protein ACOC33_00785 [bacterium]